VRKEGFLFLWATSRDRKKQRERFFFPSFFFVVTKKEKEEESLLFCFQRIGALFLFFCYCQEGGIEKEEKRFWFLCRNLVGRD